MPVLDFQQGPRPRNYLSRREQWRLLLLVFALGLVIVLAFEARKPERYRWLVGGGASEQGGRREQRGAAPGDDSTAAAPVDARPKPDVGGQAIPPTSSPGPAKPDQPAPSRYFPGVEPSRLEGIRDNKPLGPSEWDAWLHLLQLLATSDEAALRRASTGQVNFIQLLDQPEEYRGELVTTGGTIRRACRAKVPENEHGLDDYYQTWLFPADYPTDPIVVYCLHLPEGFPTGLEIEEQAEVTGFYFKVSVYQAADGTVRRAPLLLARTLHWRQKLEAADTAPPSPVLLLPLIVGSAAFALLVVGYVYYRTRRGGPSEVESLIRRHASQNPETATDVGTAMQRLARSEEERKP
jgi:hypothetical protein